MEIILISGLAIAFILFASFAEGIEWKERYLTVTNTEQEKLNRIWHWLQFFERVFAVLFGFAVGLLTGLTWLSAKIVFTAAVGFWIIYDVVINYYASRNLFRPSQYSTNIIEKFYWLKPLLIIAAILLFIVGCSAPRVIEKIRVDSIKAVSPDIEEILDAKTITDTVIITNKVVDKDTVIDVRYYPVEKKFYMKIKPDTVTITKIDTLTEIKYDKSESKSGYYLIAFVALAVIGLIFIIILKK